MKNNIYNKGKLAVWIVLCVVILIVIFGVISYKKATPPAQTPIKIGSISALTGVGSPIGEEERKGAQLAVDQINESGGIDGRAVQLISEDLSIDKMKDAGSVAHKLIDVDGVSAIVGPQWDEPAAAILPIIEQAHIPTVGADVTDNVEAEKPYDYFFSTWYDNRVGIVELLKYAEAKGLKRIAIIRLIDAGFWHFTAEEMIKDAPTYNVSIIDDQNVNNPVATDFRTFFAKLKSKNPDAVFVVISGDPNQCPFLQQANDIGLKVPILATESAGNYSSLGQCPKLMENLYFSTPVHGESYSLFAKAFNAKYGRDPQFPSAVNAYDAVGVIVDAIKKSDFGDNQSVRDALASTTDYKGASLDVPIKFNEKGFLVTPSDAFEMQTVRNGVFVEAK